MMQLSNLINCFQSEQQTHSALTYVKNVDQIILKQAILRIKSPFSLTQLTS